MRAHMYAAVVLIINQCLVVQGFITLIVRKSGQVVTGEHRPATRQEMFAKNDLSRLQCFFRILEMHVSHFLWLENAWDEG